MKTKRNFKRILAYIFLLYAGGLPSIAQTSTVRIRPGLLRRNAVSTINNKASLESTFPILSHRIMLQPRRAELTSNGPRRIIGRKASPLSSSGSSLSGASFWGTLVYLDSWDSDDGLQFGLYSTTASRSPKFSPLLPLGTFYTDYGSQYADGHIYGATMTMDDQQKPVVTIYDINADTWQASGTQMPDSSCDLLAIETAQATDGTVYGEFYTKDMKGVTFGTVDYATRTRKVIRSGLKKEYVAMGVTDDNRVYGICSDGNLYEISPTTGEEKLIGATGLDLLTANERYYDQTGEIDPRTNTFYWFAMDGTGSSGLYTVDLTTGKAKQIGYGNFQYRCALVQDIAKNGAPDKVKSLAAQFDGPALTGSVGFRMPSQTYHGDAISGSISYSLMVNGEKYKTGKAEPGDSVTVPVTVEKNGNYAFSVTTGNAAGESPRARLIKYLGYDAPEAPFDLQTDRDSTRGNILSWTEPSAGQHNGWLGQLKYNVYRINRTAGDTTLIAQGIDSTNYTDRIPASSYSVYVYGVSAVNHGVEGAMATSGTITDGNALVPDWSLRIGSPSDFDLFTVNDANSDGETWHYDTDAEAAETSYSYDNGNDDWLFTPPFRLSSDYFYKLVFRAHDGSEDYPNTLEVRMGIDTTAAGMSRTLMETSTLPKDYKIYTIEFRPDAPGSYRFGFHDNTSEAGQDAVYLDSVAVIKGVSVNAPDSVTSLKAQPAECGDLAANLTFKMPLLGVIGQPLTPDSAVILRNGNRIDCMRVDGKSGLLTYKDESVPRSGFYSYTVVPYANGAAGRSSSTDPVYIGIDTPAAPRNVSIKDNTSDILASWSPSPNSGTHGGYVDPSKVCVSFYSLEQSPMGMYIEDSIGSSTPGATSYHIAVNPDDGDVDKYLYYGVSAKNSQGQSQAVYAGSIIVGPSSALPFRESFKGGTAENGFIWSDGNQQYMQNDNAAGWRLSNGMSSDHDGGCAFWESYSTDYGVYRVSEGDEVCVGLPKVSLEGSENPKLCFDYRVKPNDKVRIRISAVRPDGTEAVIDSVNAASMQAGWHKASADLSSLKDCRYVLMKITGIAEADNASLAIDNVDIFDQRSKNMAAVQLYSKEAVRAGAVNHVNVIVRNFGESPVSNYKVVLYNEDIPVDTIEVHKTVDVLASDTAVVKLPLAINAHSPARLMARVILEGDLDPENDVTSELSLDIHYPQYPGVAELKGHETAGGYEISWKIPERSAYDRHVTESFETYSPFATEFGDWTTACGDRGVLMGFLENYSYPHQGEEASYLVFAPDSITTGMKVTDRIPGLKACSGNKYAGALYKADDNGNGTRPDNWLISPPLSGKAQRISFHVMNLATRDTYTQDAVVYRERFDFMTSSTTNDTTSFVKTAEGIADGSKAFSEGANWKEYSFDVPEGTAYFAIRQNSDPKENLLFGIDDISFDLGAEGINDSICGYCIYRDGELVAKTDSATLSFIDQSRDSGEHTYNVTVLYKDATGNVHESAFSPTLTVVATSIHTCQEADAASYDIYTIDGKAVALKAHSIPRLTPGVYIVNNRKLIVK